MLQLSAYVAVKWLQLPASSRQLRPLVERCVGQSCGRCWCNGLASCLVTVWVLLCACTPQPSLYVYGCKRSASKWCRSQAAAANAENGKPGCQGDQAVITFAVM